AERRDGGEERGAERRGTGRDRGERRAAVDREEERDRRRRLAAALSDRGRERSRRAAMRLGDRQGEGAPRRAPPRRPGPAVDRAERERGHEPGGRGDGGGAERRERREQEERARHAERLQEPGRRAELEDERDRVDRGVVAREEVVEPVGREPGRDRR